MRHKKRSAITAEVRDTRAQLKQATNGVVRLRLCFRLAFLYLEILKLFKKKEQLP